MEIDDSAALFFYTYHMMDWGTVSQEPSETRCISCGEKMMDVGPVRDKKGVVFDGLVCHSCKTILWVRKTT